MYRRILVPLDGTRFGDHALPWAVDLAQRTGASLELLHVHHHTDPEGRLTAMPQYGYENISRAELELEEEALLRVWERVTHENGPLDTIAAIGTYLKAIQEADPRFTGRAIKNITDGVKVRAMDMELPDEWMENPELFLFQSYERKLEMLREMMTPITVEMVIQEINRYADSEFRYADKSDEVAITNMVRDMERSEAAKRRYLETRG